MAGTQTIGKLLIDAAIPPDMRDTARVFDKGSTAAFFSDLARKHPDEYEEVLQRMNDISRVAGTEYGKDASIRLRDLQIPPRLREYRKQIRQRIETVAQNPNLSKEAKNDGIEKIMRKAMPTIMKNMQEEVAQRGNAFGKSVKIGFRGSPTQLAQILFGDMLVADHRGRAIPIPGVHGYGEGVTPMEYWAGTYASRKGYCLAEGTLVRMADMTVRPIEAIKAGMEVLGSNLEGNVRPVTVTNWWENGYKEVYQYKFRVGRSKALKTVTATEEHEVLSLYKEGNRDALREVIKRPLGKARRTFGLWPAKGFCPEGVAADQPVYTYGQFLGDEHFGSMSATLTSADEKAVTSVRADPGGFGIELRDIPRDRTSGMPSYEYRFIDPDRNQFGMNQFKQALLSFGFTPAKAPHKVIPEGVYDLDRARLCDFIEGYFEADGSVVISISDNKTQIPLIRFHSTSKRLLDQLQAILESRLGVYCAGIRKTKKENIPCSRSYGYSIKAQHDSYSLLISHRDSVDRLVATFEGRGRKAEKALELVESIPASPRDERLVFAFKEKEYIGVMPTYDLEVDHPDHLFVLANGAIVSNSDVQFATAKTGFLGKQLALMAQRLKVTGEDCGASEVGILADGDDPEIIGAVLARDTNGIPQGTAIDKRHLPRLRGAKPLVRSVISCQQPEGICQRCAGKHDEDGFPSIGSTVGITAARVASEPMTQQLGLSAKHTGGVVGVNDQNVSGFDEINQFLQVPKSFKGASVLAPVDGKIQQIVDAPQGGKYMHVAGEQVYVPEGRTLSVSKGDTVEAGDMMTDGTPNPAHIAAYKGLGEGRIYFLDKFTEILNKNGVPTHKRHVEALSRAFFDRVKVMNPDGVSGYAVGDTVSYGDLQRDYEPREGTELRDPSRSIGQFLEKPVMHYTIGTRITPKVAKYLKSQGVSQIKAHKEAPGFEPEVVRMMDIAGKDKDWKTRMAGFNLQRSFLDAARHGSTSSHGTTSYVSKLMDPSTL